MKLLGHWPLHDPERSTFDTGQNGMCAPTCSPTSDLAVQRLSAPPETSTVTEFLR